MAAAPHTSLAVGLSSLRFPRVVEHSTRMRQELPSGQRNHLGYVDVLVENFRVGGGADQSVHRAFRNPVGHLQARGLPGPGVGRDAHVDPLAPALFLLGLPGNGLQVPQPPGEQRRAPAHLVEAADGKHLGVHLHPVGGVTGKQFLEDAETLFPNFRMDKVEPDRRDMPGSRVFIHAHPQMVAVEHEVGEAARAPGLLGSPGPEVEVGAGEEQHPFLVAAVAEQLGPVPTLAHQLAHMQSVPIVHRMVPFAHVASVHLSHPGFVNAHPAAGGQLENEGVHRGSGDQVYRLGHVRLCQRAARSRTCGESPPAGTPVARPEPDRQPDARQTSFPRLSPWIRVRRRPPSAETACDSA